MDALLAQVKVGTMSDPDTLTTMAWSYLKADFREARDGNLIFAALILAKHELPRQDQTHADGAMRAVQNTARKLRDTNLAGEPLVRHVIQRLDMRLAKMAMDILADGGPYFNFIRGAELPFTQGALALPGGVAFPLQDVFDSLIEEPQELILLRRTVPQSEDRRAF